MGIEICESCRSALLQTVSDHEGALAELALCVTDNGCKLVDLIDRHFLTRLPIDALRVRDVLDEVLPCAFALYVMLDPEHAEYERIPEKLPEHTVERMDQQLPLDF